MTRSLLAMPNTQPAAAAAAGQENRPQIGFLLQSQTGIEMVGYKTILHLTVMGMICTRIIASKGENDGDLKSSSMVGTKTPHYLPHNDSNMNREAKLQHLNLSLA
ncbi:hypothetical protein ABZP36_008440 [Zizania latifolia]